MDDVIEHKALITKFSDEKIELKVEGLENCHTCKLKGSCLMAGNRSAYIELDNSAGRYNYSEEDYNKGESVRLVFRKYFGLTAVLFAFVIPLVLFIVSIVFFTAFLGNEVLSAFFSVLLLVFYYVFLHVFRAKWESKIIPYMVK